MTQLANDCFAFGGKLMTMHDALALLNERVTTVTPRETVALADANRRILAEDIISPIDVPPHANAAVDGYAFAYDELEPGAATRFVVSGRAAAGHPFAGRGREGEAVRVFTGAVLPEGCDTVAMQEDVRRDGDTIVVPPGLRLGSNRRKAGEDVKAGARVLRGGARLRPRDIALVAAIGRSQVPVYRRPRVALFSTGDEIREPGEDLAPGAIYDANRYLLRALLAELGCLVSDLGILPDKASAVRDGLAEAARAHDLIVTSGGVSTGEEDHVKAAVEALGALHFWRLAIKPGRPIALGTVGGAAFVGLPGNPVAVMVCFLRFARPIILRLNGASDLAPLMFRVRADFEHRKKRDRREWLRAKLSLGPGGETLARKFERQGSGLITSLTGSDGLVELGEEVTELARGTMVDFLPFGEVGA